MDELFIFVVVFVAFVLNLFKSLQLPLHLLNYNLMDCLKKFCTLVGIRPACLFCIGRTVVLIHNQLLLSC